MPTRRQRARLCGRELCDLRQEPRASADIDLATLTATQGFRIFGADAGDQSGCSVSSAGDVNGDGFDDLIVGARVWRRVRQRQDDAGESYVIFGKSTGFADIDLATLTAAKASASSARTRATVGLFGLLGRGRERRRLRRSDRRALGADAATRTSSGESYVIFGKSTGFADIDLATLTAAQGFRIFGADAATVAAFRSPRPGT